MADEPVTDAPGGILIEGLPPAIQSGYRLPGRFIAHTTPDYHTELQLPLLLPS